MRTCSVQGCARPHKARGYCYTHWASWRRTGVKPTEPVRAYGRSCSVQGCERPHRAKGWCEFHYDRMKATGDPLRRNPRYKPPRQSVITMRAVHLRLDRDRGKASAHSCSHCGAQANDWAYDWGDANALSSPGGTLYSLDQSHYMPLCTPCHMKLDWHRARNKQAG